MERSRTVAALLLAGLLAAACPADDDGDGATPSPAATAAADPCRELGVGEQVGLPVLFVTAPEVGAAVASPLQVGGCTNAFEATVNWQLVDRDGATLADGFATATCGNGCLGTFSFEIAFSVAAETIGTLRVFTISAEDGSEQDVNAIPLRLQP